MDEFQPQAAPDTEAIGFPVDLSREEYIAFNMLLAKNGACSVSARGSWSFSA